MLIIRVMIGDLTNDAIRIMYKELQKEKNKQRISIIIEMISGMIFKNVLPYMYAIIAILVIMFLMNVFQFYYYVKYFLFVKKSSPLTDHTDFII
jgi:hypothetical protein